MSGSTGNGSRYTIKQSLIFLLKILHEINFYMNKHDFYLIPPSLFQGEQGTAECVQSLQTLFSILYTMTRMMAPYTPFLTEHMFQNLRHLLPWTLSNDNASIHYIMLPKPRYSVCVWQRYDSQIQDIKLKVFGGGGGRGVKQIYTKTSQNLNIHLLIVCVVVV